MIRSLLIQIRRRLAAQHFCERLAQATLWGAVLLAGFAVLHRCSGQTLALTGTSIEAIAVLAAAGLTWRARLSLTEVALLLDRRAGTRDRLATGFAFENPATPMEASALAECETYLRAHFDGRRCTLWRVPKALRWIAAPVVLIVAVQVWRAPATGALVSVPAHPAIQIAVRTAGELEQMAARLEAKPEQSRPADLQKVSEALKRSAARLRQEAAGTATSASKATLCELSALEELMRSMQDGSALDVLGESLAKTDDGKAAAQALKKHDPKAPEKLEELGKKLVEGKDMEKPMKQLATAMADAAAKLGERSALGKAASDAASAAGSGEGTKAGQAMGKLGQAVREMNSSGAGEGSGSQQMQGMISKLQEMKSGQDGGKAESPSSSNPNSGNRGNETKSMAQTQTNASSKQKPNDSQTSGENSNNGERPQSELDRNAKKTPFGSVSPGDYGKPGKQVQIAGTLGRSGESLRAMIATRPGAESAHTEYKPLYDAAKPAAEDALAGEPIPVGSRLFVRRYFEAIRPK